MIMKTFTPLFLMLYLITHIPITKKMTKKKRITRNKQTKNIIEITYYLNLCSYHPLSSPLTPVFCDRRSSGETQRFARFAIFSR